MRTALIFPEWNQETWDRLFGYRHAFDEPVVVVIVSILGIALAITPLAILILDRAGRLGPDLKDDLWRRYLSWLVMVPLVVRAHLAGGRMVAPVIHRAQLALLPGVRQGDGSCFARS